MAKKGKHKPSQSSDVVVSDVQQPLFRRLFSKKNLLIIGIIALVVGLGFGAQYLYSKITAPKEKNPTVAVCTSSSNSGLLKETLNNFDPKKLASLEGNIKAIEKLKNYDKDPTCLLLTTNYYVLVQDSQKARADYNKLIVIYKPEKIEKTVAESPNIYGLPYLKDSIEFREAKDKKAREGKLQGGRSGP